MARPAGNDGCRHGNGGGAEHAVLSTGSRHDAGTLLEVDKTKQIAYVIQNGGMKYIFNVSTGNGRTYDEEDQKNAGRRSIGIALTPNGTFRTYRETDDPRYASDLGTLYRPKFVVGGIAMHGARNVPNYPASHGCIRVANPVMDLIWGADLLPLRSTGGIRLTRRRVVSRTLPRSGPGSWKRACR